MQLKNKECLDYIMPVIIYNHKLNKEQTIEHGLMTPVSLTRRGIVVFSCSEKEIDQIKQDSEWIIQYLKEKHNFSNEELDKVIFHTCLSDKPLSFSNLQSLTKQQYISKNQDKMAPFVLWLRQDYGIDQWRKPLQALDESYIG